MGAYELEMDPRPGNLAIHSEDRWHVISGTPTFAWEFFSADGRPQTSFELVIQQVDPPVSGQVWAVTGAGQKSVIYAGPQLIDGRTYSYTISATDDRSHPGHARSFFRMNSRPAVPLLKSPVEWSLLSYASVSLSVHTVAALDGDTVCYDFEIADDITFTENAVMIECIASTGDSARTPILGNVQPGRTYWWRARSFDRWERSDWSYARPLVTRAVGVVRVPVDKATIQEAISSAGDGDTILVSPGEYLENLDFLGKRLLVASEAGAKSTVIRAADTARHVVRFSRREPKGTTIRGFTLTGSMRGGVRADSSSPGIEDCIIAGNRAHSHPRSGGGIFLYRTAGSSIVGNTIRNNYAKDYGSAILLDNCSDDTIAFNVCYSNDGIGDIRGTSTTAYLRNNTIISKTWTGILAQAVSEFEAVNNLICFAPKKPIDSDGSSKIVARYYYHYGSGIYSSTDEYPQFVDTAAGDYRLLPTSPCVDAGDPNLELNDPDGSRGDIGAFPYVPGLTANLSDDVNHDGVVDVRDAVRLIDQTVRAEKTAGETQPTDLHRVRGMIERLWERTDGDQQK